MTKAIKCLLSHLRFWLQLKKLDLEIWRHRNEPDPEDEEMDVINQFLDPDQTED